MSSDKSPMDKILANTTKTKRERFKAVSDCITENKKLIVDSDEWTSKAVGLCNVASSIAMVIPGGQGLGALLAGGSMICSFFAPSQNVPSTADIVKDHLDKATKEVKIRIDAMESKLLSALEELKQRMDETKIVIQNDINMLKEQIKAQAQKEQIDEVRSHLIQSGKFLFGADYFGDPEKRRLPSLKIGQISDHLTLGDQLTNKFKFFIQDHLSLLEHSYGSHRSAEQDSQSFLQSLNIAQNYYITLYCNLAVLQTSLWLLLSIHQLSAAGEDCDENVGWFPTANDIQKDTTTFVTSSLVKMFHLDPNQSWSCLKDTAVRKYANDVAIVRDKTQYIPKEETGLPHDEFLNELLMPKFAYCVQGNDTTEDGKVYKANFQLKFQQDGSILGTVARTQSLENYTLDDDQAATFHGERPMTNMFTTLSGWNWIRTSIKATVRCPNLYGVIKSDQNSFEKGSYDWGTGKIAFSVVVNGKKYEYNGTFNGAYTITGTWISHERDLSICTMSETDLVNNVITNGYIGDDLDTIGEKILNDIKPDMTTVKALETQWSKQIEKGTFSWNISRWDYNIFELLGHEKTVKLCGNISPNAPSKDLAQIPM